MANITIRNIPEDVFSKIKQLSTLEKRSINNEILLILESGLISELNTYEKSRGSIPKELQLKIWKDLSGRWED